MSIYGIKGEIPYYYLAHKHISTILVHTKLLRMYSVVCSLDYMPNIIKRTYLSSVTWLVAN